MRKAVAGAVTLFSAVKRPLTVSSSTSSHPKRSKPDSRHVDQTAAPIAFDKQLVSVILSVSHLDYSLCHHLLSSFTPHQFDALFWEIHCSADPSTVLKFFYFSCNSCVKFTLRSYCLLYHLLISKNVDSAARLLLIRLIDRNLPITLADGAPNMHLEIVDVLVLVSRRLLPSFKTCNFFMSSLVKANEFNRSYEVFVMIFQDHLPDVFLFSTAIDALCKAGRTEDAATLFKKMENLGVKPNVVTYNNLMHGFCEIGNLDEAFQLKRKLVDNKVDPSVITYSILINGLMNSRNMKKLITFQKSCWRRGLPPMKLFIEH